MSGHENRGVELSVADFLDRGAGRQAEDVREELLLEPERLEKVSCSAAPTRGWHADVDGLALQITQRVDPGLPAHENRDRFGIEPHHAAQRLHPSVGRENVGALKGAPLPVGLREREIHIAVAQRVDVVERSRRAFGRAAQDVGVPGVYQVADRAGGGVVSALQIAGGHVEKGERARGGGDHGRRQCRRETEHSGAHGPVSDPVWLVRVDKSTRSAPRQAQKRFQAAGSGCYATNVATGVACRRV